LECGIRSDETFLFTSFFWTYAALIITIVAVSVLSGKLSYVDKETNERSQTKTKQNNPPQTQRKHQNMSKTDHGEKVKQVQAFTAIYTSPALTSSLAGNEQALEGAVRYAAPFNCSNLASSHLFDILFLGPMNGLTAMCKQADILNLLPLFSAS